MAQINFMGDKFAHLVRRQELQLEISYCSYTNVDNIFTMGASPTLQLDMPYNFFLFFSSRNCGKRKEYLTFLSYWR
jgi:hypothetical protein